MKLDANRFDVTDSKTMMAVVTTGNGGYDMLQYKAVPIPAPSPGEVLCKCSQQASITPKSIRAWGGTPPQ